MQTPEERPAGQHGPWRRNAIRTLDAVSWVVFVLWLWLPNGTHWITVLLDLVLLWIVVRSFLRKDPVQSKPESSRGPGAGSIAEP